jgi:hypothetical protein
MTLPPRMHEVRESRPTPTQKGPTPRPRIPGPPQHRDSTPPKDSEMQSPYSASSINPRATPPSFHTPKAARSSSTA